MEEQKNQIVWTDLHSLFKFVSVYVMKHHKPVTRKVFETYNEKSENKRGPQNRLMLFLNDHNDRPAEIPEGMTLRDICLVYMGASHKVPIWLKTKMNENAIRFEIDKNGKLGTLKDGEFNIFVTHRNPAGAKIVEKPNDSRSSQMSRQPNAESCNKLMQIDSEKCEAILDILTSSISRTHLDVPIIVTCEQLMPILEITCRMIQSSSSHSNPGTLVVVESLTSELVNWWAEVAPCKCQIHLPPKSSATIARSELLIHANWLVQMLNMKSEKNSDDRRDALIQQSVNSVKNPGNICMVDPGSEVTTKPSSDTLSKPSHFSFSEVYLPPTWKPSSDSMLKKNHLSYSEVYLPPTMKHSSDSMPKQHHLSISEPYLSACSKLSFTAISPPIFKVTSPPAAPPAPDAPAPAAGDADKKSEKKDVEKKEEEKKEEEKKDGDKKSEKKSEKKNEKKSELKDGDKKSEKKSEKKNEKKSELKDVDKKDEKKDNEKKDEDKKSKKSSKSKKDEKKEDKKDDDKKDDDKKEDDKEDKKE